MRKVVLCFAHKDEYLLNTQIEQFLCHNSETDIFIHLDKKSEAMKDKVLVNEHVHFIKNNVSVKWGDDTMMKALFASFREIAESGGEYDWCIITTGQDLQVRKGLDEFLEINKGRIFLDALNDSKSFSILLPHRIPRSLCNDSYSLPFYHPRRIMLSFYFRLMKYNLIPQKKIVYDWKKLKFYYSFNWSIMPFDVFAYCADYIEKTPGYKELYSDTLLPEDGFLATLILNSKYADRVVWKNERETRTMTYHSAFKVHPKVLGMADVSEIDHSDCFFARKFDSKVDKEVVDYYKQIVIE